MNTRINVDLSYRGSGKATLHSEKKRCAGDYCNHCYLRGTNTGNFCSLCNRKNGKTVSIPVIDVEKVVAVARSKRKQ